MRILNWFDTHLRDKDPGGIRGYVRNSDYMLDSILDTIKNHNIDMAVHGGDIYDKGYHSIPMFYHHNNKLRKITEALNGNNYAVVGNHIQLERDINPELYSIHPCAVARPEWGTLEKLEHPNEPIFRVVDNLRIHDVEISFFHYSKFDKNYYRTIPEDTKYHIAYYHDDSAIPSHVLREMGYYHTSVTSILANLYSNVNLAMHGHIHKDYEPFVYNNTLVWIPGAASITANDSKYIQPSVKLPIIEIHEDSSVSFETVELDLGLKNLTFLEKRNTKERKKLNEMINNEAFAFDKRRYTSIGDYLRSHESPSYMYPLIEAAGSGRLDLPTLGKILDESQGEM